MYCNCIVLYCTMYCTVQEVQKFNFSLDCFFLMYVKCVMHPYQTLGLENNIMC